MTRSDLMPLLTAVLSDNRRVERADKAALGAIQHLLTLTRAVDTLFKSAGSNDQEVYAAAVDALRVAHNEAVGWAHDEAARVRERSA